MKGDNLFKEYWRRPDATAEAFDSEGWFKTGDTAAQQGSPPYWRILGRSSVDIIKSGGYKISALAIENVLLEHPDIAECAVVGLEDETQGQIVAAVVACQEGGTQVTRLRTAYCATGHPLCYLAGCLACLRCRHVDALHAASMHKCFAALMHEYPLVLGLERCQFVLVYACS